MPELSARLDPRFAEPASHGTGRQTKAKGAKLVSGCEPAGVLLGAGAGLPSHCAHLYELRAARVFAARLAGATGEPLAAPSRQSPGAQGGTERNGYAHRGPGRASALAT